MLPFGVTIVPDDFATVVDPVGKQVANARHVDRSEAASTEEKSMRSGDVRIPSYDLPKIVDPIDNSHRCVGNIDAGEAVSFVQNPCAAPSASL